MIADLTNEKQITIYILNGLTTSSWVDDMQGIWGIVARMYIYQI
jgi:hypothetical protein